MRRFVVCQLASFAVVLCGLAGCGGGGEMEGMPTDTTYRAPVMPDAMKGAMTPNKAVPQAGTPGKARAVAPEAQK